MKKTLYILGFIILVIGCKYDDKAYSFVREYDDGTYMTFDGVAKYISGNPDSIVSVHDIYATVKEHIRYVDNDKDSILMYGHCWSTTKGAVVKKNNATRYMVNTDQDTIPEPDEFIKDLESNSDFESVIYNLAPETEYFIRSYVITGRFNDGKVVYVDTAYNQAELSLTTDAPEDAWQKKSSYEAGRKGAVSFVYKGELYVGMGHNELQVSNKIYKYSPQNDSWTSVGTYPGVGIGSDRISSAVAFVIENVKTGYGTYHDYVYIGTGFYLGGSSDTIATGGFWRWNFDNEWVEFRDGSNFEYTGGKRRDAVAFTVNGIGYVGLGTGHSGAALNDFYKFDPENTDENHTVGTWTSIGTFPPGQRTKAVSFLVDGLAFISCGAASAEKDQDTDEMTYSDFRNDLWMFRQTDDDGDGGWSQKESFPGTARVDAVGYNIGSMGYLGTGWDGNKLCSDYWRYNPYSNTWDQRIDFYNPIGGSTQARTEAIGAGIIYSDGDYRGFIGLGKGLTTSDYYSDFYVYRP